MRVTLTLPLVVTSLVLQVASSSAQTPSSGLDAFEARVAEVAGKLGHEPQFKDMPEERREGFVQFIIGNMLFAVAHEMGHAVISEMELPVLGREEDAADSFAIIAGVRMMNDFSERALIEAGKGWFFYERKDRKEGAMTSFYDSHGMNLQRAYQIVCFMVGASPEKFKALAVAAKMPAERQKTCQDDYAITAWSWEELLKPHLRTPDKPRTDIAVTYGEATGRLETPARIFKELRFLETIANMAADRYVWRSPYSMEMKTCGFVNAKWSVKNRNLFICYELVAEYADLYREFGNDPDMSKKLPPHVR